MVSVRLMLSILLPISLVAATPHSLYPRYNVTNGTTGLLHPKVFILNAVGFCCLCLYIVMLMQCIKFTPEAASFYAVTEFNLLAHNITVPGFSPKFPQAHCTLNGEICQATTGESGKLDSPYPIDLLLYHLDLTHDRNQCGIHHLRPPLQPIV